MFSELTCSLREYNGKSKTQIQLKNDLNTLELKWRASNISVMHALGNFNNLFKIYKLFLT